MSQYKTFARLWVTKYVSQSKTGTNFGREFPDEIGFFEKHDVLISQKL